MPFVKKLLPSILLIAIVCSAQMLPGALAAAGLWAWIMKECGYETSNDSVDGDLMLSNRFRYSVGVWNPGPGLVRDAKVAFSSAYPSQVLIAEAWGNGRFYNVSKVGNAYEYSWRLPEIQPETDQSIWLETELACKFSPGFDSARYVGPTVLDSESVIQEVLIHVVPIRQLTRIQIAISLEESQYVQIELEKRSDRPRLDYISSDWIQWNIESPKINRSYDFRVLLRLTNLAYPSKVEVAPFVQIRGYEYTRDYDWSGREWRSTSVDADLKISNVTISAPGTSRSTVQLQTASAVRYLSRSTAHLMTTVTVEGLPERSMASLRMIVDNAYAPSEFTIAGSTTVYLREGRHEIQVPRTIEASEGVRYYCETNRVSLSESEVSTYLKAGSLSLTFNYVQQFLLVVHSWADANRTTGWLKSGTIVTVRASPFYLPNDVPLILRPFSVFYRFRAWEGTIESDSPTVTFGLAQPTNMTAVWVPDYSSVIVATSGILVSVFAIGLLIVVRGRRTKRKLKRGVSDIDTLLQRLETLKTSGSISELAYRRLRSEYEAQRSDN